MRPSASKIMVLGALLAFPGSPSLIAEADASDEVPPLLEKDREASARLQIFLDRAEFAPGKIDGRNGQFTAKALQLYRESLGKTSEIVSGKDDLSGLDLASVDPVFIIYTVTHADVANLGKVPEAEADQAKLTELPYETVIEVIAEKFHADVDFLSTLNPEKAGEVKEGDRINVPNVVPFDLAAVKDLEIGSKVGATPAIVPGDGTVAQAEASAAPTTAVAIDITTSMLTLREHGKLVAAYPVTIGSDLTESPVGDWEIKGIAKMPDYRFDKALLDLGVRSDEFNILPPGPNNPVGVIWIELNKEGIGLHGTSDPDSIGRSSSHGCVRMANWDVTRLVERIKAGVPVAIH